MIREPGGVCEGCLLCEEMTRGVFDHGMDCVRVKDYEELISDIIVIDLFLLFGKVVEFDKA